MVDYWKKNPNKWEPIDQSQAQDLANAGWFAVAGLEDTPNGHVVVIVPGTATVKDGVSWPQCMDTGKNMKVTSQSIRQSWRAKNKDGTPGPLNRVKYYKYK